jgi:hypothetical protein
MSKARELSQLGDAVTVDAGNVGIGTASPSVSLEVNSGTASTVIKQGTTGTPTSVWYSDTNGTMILAADDNNTGVAPRLQFNVSGTESMRIDASGNVGIGTATPTFASGEGLQVSKSAGAVVSVIDPDNVGSFDLLKSGNEGYLFNRGNGAIIVGTNGTERMRIDAGGRLLVGTTTTSVTADSVIVNGSGIMVSEGGTNVTSGAGYIEISLNPGGGAFLGTLAVANTRVGNAAVRTHATYSIFGRGTDVVATLIASDNGPTGGASFSFSYPSLGVIRANNISGNTSDMYMYFYGGAAT